MNEETAIELLEKYRNGNCTPEEAAAITQWLDNMGNRAGAALSDKEEAIFNGQVEAAILQGTGIDVSQRPYAPITAAPVGRSHFLKTGWFRYAAILLLFAGAAIYLYRANRPQHEIVSKQPLVQPDILPGGNKAVLTLADGTTILLDSASTGALAQQGNTKIIKLNAGSLAYNAGSAGGEVLYNTISTPKGGQYQITLPDGSMVWLNAASSVKFPTVFTGHRKIDISGEVYIEAAADRSRPFSVTVNGLEVQVLGTSFNINAYTNESSIRTTLVNGSVQVKQDNEKVLLKPGQQAVLSSNGTMQIATPDISNVLAWKNGFFNFEGLSLKEFMRQVERWYDVEVVYPPSVPDVRFIGGMERNSSLHDLLERLDKLDVHTRLSGRKLIIMPDTLPKK